jgi:MoxR-like ATPase
MSVEIEKATAAVEEHSPLLEAIHTQLRRVIIGQEHLLDRLLIGLLANGHLLLEGVPGLAKTLAARSLAGCLDAEFKRIQFTPDLLPADLIGTQVFDQKTTEFFVNRGPVFTNLLLADEINRAPAKVQSALLESMQERQVTIGGTCLPLPEPFMVLATQNPIELEGTYPLPEAQVDRFMMKVLIDYPNRDEELLIIDQQTEGEFAEVKKTATPEQVLNLQKVAGRIYIDSKLKGYIADLIVATRPPLHGGLKNGQYIEYGASPRASIYLAQASKARAFLQLRGFVVPEDIKEIAPDILRHRIAVSYQGQAENISSEDIINELLNSVKIP